MFVVCRVYMHEILQYTNTGHAVDPPPPHRTPHFFTQRHASKLVSMENSGLVSMLKDDKLEDLTRLNALFQRVPSTLDDVKTVMRDYVVQCGMDLVREQEERRDPVKVRPRRSE